MLLQYVSRRFTSSSLPPLQRSLQTLTASNKTRLSAAAVASSSSSPLSSRSYTTHKQLPEEHQMIYEMCRKFADEELAPNAGEWDKQHAFPTEAITQLERV
uniref:Acyl-CoA dehydrogenase/oxidase N-terminal domain-containing protein n=1 Tax=Ditylum brightwellii TaxID=49249 RepID=A0A7S1Z140_9STRA